MALNFSASARRCCQLTSSRGNKSQSLWSSSSRLYCHNPCLSQQRPFPKSWSLSIERAYAAHAPDVNPPTTTSDPRSPPPRPPKERNARNAISLALFILTGVGLYVYFKNEKIKVEERKREERANKSVGKVKIGGPFELINAKDGKPFTEKDLLGKFSLIYFGFTNCPDICPEELDKMCEAINRLSSEKVPISIQPIFVSVDPNRDTREAIVKYLKDFDPKLIGLTGAYENIKSMCKVYRVYFSTPPNVKPGDDYLVDHSIFFYLMAPNGNFVDAFGKIFSKDDVYEKVKTYATEWSNGKRFGEEEV
ncbi:hypothetical protein O181_000465 [Austropuccinia psidii MF-1]|uniref:Thioredoxin domain-containing protein n=1 Tax=Austropuccinia psidii MF-1 TaxID=1389203 RepID=A0A9Q3GAW8_9BASI|nr:hypothetical protein [Austropuccinia psidii MF-1]